MKITVRNVYLTEFAEMSYFQRLFFELAYDVKLKRPNANPLDWCVRDVLKIIDWVLYGGLAWIMVPVAFYSAHKLKTHYVDSDASTYIPNKRVIE